MNLAAGAGNLEYTCHLTVNTEGWNMEKLASAVERFVLSWYGR